MITEVRLKECSRKRY